MHWQILRRNFCCDKRRTFIKGCLFVVFEKKGRGDNIGVNKPKRMFPIFSCELVILNDLPRTILNNSYARNKDVKTIANHTYHKVYNTCIKDDCYFYANQT